MSDKISNRNEIQIQEIFIFTNLDINIIRYNGDQYYNSKYIYREKCSEWLLKQHISCPSKSVRKFIFTIITKLDCYHYSSYNYMFVI